MKTAGIAIDAWKLDTFKRVLDGAGYSYTQHPGPSPETLFLKVKVESGKIHRLQNVVKQAQDECRKDRGQAK